MARKCQSPRCKSSCATSRNVTKHAPRRNNVNFPTAGLFVLQEKDPLQMPTKKVSTSKEQNLHVPQEDILLNMDNVTECRLVRAKLYSVTKTSVSASKGQISLWHNNATFAQSHAGLDQTRWTRAVGFFWPNAFLLTHFHKGLAWSTMVARQFWALKILKFQEESLHVQQEHTLPNKDHAHRMSICKGQLFSCYAEASRHGAPQNVFDFKEQISRFQKKT